jgi:hypothetical protein
MSDPGGAEARPAAGLDRAAVWQRLGAPSDQVGSVNDPRTQSEYGCDWNEKWIWRAGGEIVRVALFDRYDLQGIFRMDPDGSVVAEPVHAVGEQADPETEASGGS